MINRTILVATWEDGLFAVTGDGRTQEIAKQLVRGLAADGRGGALGIVGSNSLCSREPSGNWATVVTSKLELSCCMSVQGTIYVGTDDARMLQLSDSQDVLKAIDGFDKVAGRDTWFAGSAIVNGQRLGPPLGIRSVAANSDASVLFANAHVGGIPRSVDGGRTWEPTIAVRSDVHEVRAHPTDSNLVVAAAAVGVCISRDAGATWTIERDGLHASYCSAITFSGSDLIVSVSTDHFAAEGRIYRRSVQPGGSLSAIRGGLPTWMEGIVDTGCIASEGAFLAVADRTGHLYTSDDFGSSWSCQSSCVPTPSGLLIV